VGPGSVHTVDLQVAGSAAVSEASAACLGTWHVRNSSFQLCNTCSNPAPDAKAPAAESTSCSCCALLTAPARKRRSASLARVLMGCGDPRELTPVPRTSPL
jgi:hypothetical protein